jgi:polyphosphate kinase 2 (PPK2 family)
VFDRVPLGICHEEVLVLEKINLAKEMKRKEWKEMRRPLQHRLYELAQAAYDTGIPTIVLFEGWDASGKGTSINLLTQRLDPRGFKVWPIRAPRTYEQNHPWLWRFWNKLPNRGQIAIFDRSWYGRVLVERVEKLTPETEWRKAYRDIVDFERTLADDGHIIAKLWMHISKKEQRRRFKALEKDPLQSWHVQPEDWEHYRKYDKYLLAVEEMLETTETEWAPWTIVEATDQHYTWWRVFTAVADALAKGLKLRGIDPESVISPLPDAGTDAAESPLAGKTAAEEAATADVNTPGIARMAGHAAEESETDALSHDDDDDLD